MNIPNLLLSRRTICSSISAKAEPAIVYLAAITLVSAAIRTFGLASKSIWYDEAFVITLAQMPIQELFSNLVALDPHPPLYYLFMHVWTRLGTDPTVARFPSVMFSALSVPLMYATGCRLVGRQISLAAATALAFSPFHVEWAQETRMYALLGFLCIGSTYYLVKSVQDGGRWNWIGLSLLTAAAIYTQLNAIFYLFAQDLAIFLLIVRGRLPQKTAIAWFCSQLVAALLFLPWLPFAFKQLANYSEVSYASTSLKSIEGVIFQLIYGQLPYWRLTPSTVVEPRNILTVSTLMLMAIGAWSFRRNPLGTLLPLLFLLTISSLAIVGYWKALLLPKTVIGATFPGYLLMAAGFAALKRRSALVGGIALFVLLSSLGIAKYYSMGSREDWGEAVGYLSRWMKPGEVVLVDCSAGLMPLNYYLDKMGRKAEVYGVPFHSWAVSPPPLTTSDLARVDQITAGRPGVWLIVYRNGFRDGDGDLLPYLADRLSLEDARSLTKLRLFHFAPTGLDLFDDVRHQIYLGAWVGERVNIPGDLNRFQEAIGKPLAIVHRYSDNPPYFGQRFDSEWATSVRRQGSIPMLSWQPGFGRGTRSLSSVAASEQDGFIARWADQLRDWGHPIFLRMMWEQNSSWFAWKAYQEPQISEYVAAWRHIVDVFRARGARNVTFVWSPHVSGNGAGEIMPTYPGDDYVDWVALDGYPYRSGRGDFIDTFGPDYDLLVSTVNKPIMIAETSLESWSDELKARWISEILSKHIPSRFPELKALVWFEEKNTDGLDYSILQDQGPLSQVAFRAGVASRRYLSNYFGDLEISPIPPPDALDGVFEDRRAFASPAVSQTEVSSENLIADPSFEAVGPESEWDSPWIVPPWIRTIVRRDRGDSFAGSYSMRHLSTKGESYTVYQDVPVVAGAEYEVSTMVKVEETLGFGKATLAVQPLNQHGGALETRVLASWSSVTNGWVEVKGTVRMPKGTSKARVQVQVTSLRGAFRLDDFKMKRSEG